MRDQIQFTMPEDPELYLAALAVVEAYELYLDRLVKGKTNKEKQILTGYEIWINYVPEAFEDIIPGNILVGVQKDLKNTFEFTFDKDRAMKVGIATNKHVVEAFTIMLGIEPQSIFPSLLKEMNGTGILLLKDQWEGWNDLEFLLSINFSELQVIKAENKVSKENIELIKAARLIIGERSALTYYACGMKKQVVEWSSDPYKGWLARWENPNYRLLSLKEKPLTPTAITRILMSWDETKEFVSL